jgi:hypothetical protein
MPSTKITQDSATLAEATSAQPSATLRKRTPARKTAPVRPDTVAIRRAPVAARTRKPATEPGAEGRSAEARAAIAMAAEGCTCTDGLRLCRMCHGQASVKVLAGGVVKPFRYKTPAAVVQAAVAAGYAKPCTGCAGESLVPCGSCPKGEARKAELATA